jgi:hypothetical protein
MLNSVKKLQSRGEAETGTVRPLVVIFVFFWQEKFEIRISKHETNTKFQYGIIKTAGHELF